MSALISILITFLVVILVLYLVNMLPIEGRAKQIVRIIVIIIGILSLLKYLGVWILIGSSPRADDQAKEVALNVTPTSGPQSGRRLGRPRAVARGPRSRLPLEDRFEFLARDRAGRHDRDVRADVRRAALSRACAAFCRCCVLSPSG